MNDPLETLALFLPGETRRLTRQGVEIHRRQYWADALAPWVADHRDLLVLYDPRDVSFVYVRPPVGPLIKAMDTTPGVLPISLAEWEARRQAERAESRHPDLIARRDASLKRSDELVSTAKSRRRERRRLATQAAGDPHRAPTAQAASPEPERANECASLPVLPALPIIFEIEDYDHVY